MVKVRSRPPSRKRLKPFQILAILSYGTLSFLGEPDPRHSWRRPLRLGPAARHFRVSSSRLREHLTWLDRYGYLQDLKLERGRAWFSISMPHNAGTPSSPRDHT